jgi:hypothetical protein
MEIFSCNDLLFTAKSTLEKPQTEDTTINLTN